MPVERARSSHLCTKKSFALSQNSVAYRNSIKRITANRNEEESKQTRAYHTRSFIHGIKQGRRQKQQIHGECCEKAENKDDNFLVQRST